MWSNFWFQHENCHDTITESRSHNEKAMWLLEFIDLRVLACCCISSMRNKNKTMICALAQNLLIFSLPLCQVYMYNAAHLLQVYVSQYYLLSSHKIVLYSPECHFSNTDEKKTLVDCCQPCSSCICLSSYSSSPSPRPISCHLSGSFTAISFMRFAMFGS